MFINQFSRHNLRSIIALILIAGISGSDLFDCDFFNNTCDWVDVDEVWTIGSSISDHHNYTWTPIQGDHHSGSGGYLYLDPVKLSSKKSRLGLLTSPKLTYSKVCLTFWYYMFGLEPSELFIVQSVGKTENFVWTRQSNFGRQWIKSSVDLVVDPDDEQPWTVSFRAAYSNINHEILAIDDVRLFTGICSSEICDFESSSCSLTNQSVGASFWTFGSAAELNHPLIVTDHSTQTEFGHLAYIHGVEAKDVAILRTRTFNHAGQRCLKFWYTSTSDSAEMKIYQVDQHSNEQLWKRNRNHFGDWRQGIVQLKEMTTTLYNIDFRVDFSQPNGGYYALDDITIELGSCPNPVNCDFTHDTCQWVTTNTMETFDWIRMNGQLLGSGLIGPGNGEDDKDDDDFYLYAYFDPSLSIESAIIDSGDFDVTKQDHYCLQFNVFTVNRMKLELIVEMLQNSNEMKPVLILKYEDLPESGWQEINSIINVNDTLSVNDFQFLRLRAIYVSEDEELGPDGKPKPHPFAAIAIDDITLTEGLCGGHEPTLYPPITTLPPPINKDFFCDFEADLCGLFNDPLKSTSPWYRRTSTRYKSDVKNVPAYDNTLGQPDGHFIFSRLLTKGDKKVSELSTQTIRALDSINGGCLSFWYYIRGTKAISLSISMVRSDDLVEELIWKRTNNYADAWNYGYVNIPSVTYDFKLKLIADHATDSDSGIALDDIGYSVGSCPASVHYEGCDFELGSCGFDNANVYDEVWQLAMASESVGTDYTTQTGAGSLLVAQSDPRPADDDEDDKTGYLVYDKFISSKYNCIKFAVNVHDGQLSFISTFAGDLEEMADQILWSVNETTGWTLVRLPLPYPGDAKLIAYRFIGQGYAALDDVTFLTECQPVGYCNFEEDNCGWTPDSDYTSFRRQNGRLSDEYSPPYDITTKKDSGSYSVVSFEKTKKSTNEKYSLTSPLISPMIPMTNYCLSFWYYKNGKDVPTLHAILNQNDSKGNKKSTYLITIDPSSRVDFWDRKSIPITQTQLLGGPFTIEFRASVKSSTGRPALVAIDDIELYPGQCSDSIEAIDETVYWCDSQTKNLTGNLFCDFYRDCKDGRDEANCGYNCDFETGSCGWKGGVKPDTALKIIDLDKTTIIPKYEINFNETGKGKYWKLNTKTSTTLTYLSPVMRNSGEHCYIDFYLYMNIEADEDAQLKSSDLSNLPHLSISLIDLRSTQVTPIHEVVNDLGKNWYVVRLYIGRVPSDFQLRFEVRSEKSSDRIAIDQITADSACAVPRIGDVDSCPSNQFFCSRSKRCIDPSLVCDYCDDCGDGEDEEDDLARCSLRSGRCDFNQGHFCDWAAGTPPAASLKEKWKIIDYDDDTFDLRSTIPTRDHTVNTAEGKFVISTGTTGLPGYSLSSPSLFRPDPESVCSFNFYYQFTDAQSVVKAVNSSAIGQSNHNYLEVQIVLPHLTNSRNSLETILGSYLLESPHFKRATINIGPEVVAHNRLFQLSLSAVRSSDAFSSWAVDDVSFSSDCILADCYLRCGQDQSCVSLDRRCDFISDCDSTEENVSGADEADCTSTNCPFGQDDMCHWEIIKTNDTNNLTWKLYQPLSDPVKQPQFIPKLDATNQDASGWLLLFDSRDSTITGSVELWSQMIGRSSAQCSLSFNYFCRLDQCGLTIYLETDIDRPGTNLKRLWEPHHLSTNHDLTAKWRPGIALIGAIKYARIMFRASDADDEQFAIGLDDLTFVNCAPPQPSSIEEPCDSMTSFQCANDNCIDKTLECDFVDDCLDGSDESFCKNLPARCDFETPCISWQPDPYRYDRFSSVSWAQTTDLPQYDHTLGVPAGTYLSISGSQKPVDLWARHYSQIISGSKTKGGDCSINLWANLIDNLLTSELIIYQRFNYSKTGYQVIARISQSYLGEYWKKYHIKLPETDDDYQVILEGFIAANNDASINIDDITLTSGCILADNGTVLPGEPDEPITSPPLTTPLFECYYGYKPCSSVIKCYPTEAECDFKDDCGDGTDEATCQAFCTFEHDWCGWTNDKLESGRWIIQKANDSNKLPRDHTENDETGSYGLATFEQEVNSFALLNSPQFTSSGPRCTFTFYYHMTLETVTDEQPRLQVYLNQGNESKLIQSLGGKHTDEWYSCYVNIGQHDEPFSVTIEAIKLNESAALIKAIDDVAFEDCLSTKKTIIEDCPINQWECESKCLPVTQLCDGFNDCNDGQDEVNCPVVNGNCEFTSSWRGQCSWIVNDATEPDVAETCSIINPSSKDMNYIEIIAKDKWACDTTLISPKFPPTDNEDHCHFTFQYKTKTKSDETLIKVGLISDGNSIELKKFKGNRVSDDWTIYHLAINHSKPYQVYLIVSIDDDSVINLKSFRFSPNCPTGQSLTLDLFPHKAEPWEPSIQPRPVTTTKSITTEPISTQPPVTQPPATQPIPTIPAKPSTKPTTKPEPLTKKPEINCNCDDNSISDECRSICHKPSPQIKAKEHSSAFILYLSFGLIGLIVIIILVINFSMPIIKRYRYRHTVRGILDDRFNDDSQFDIVDGRDSVDEQNLFGLMETRTRLRNYDDSL